MTEQQFDTIKEWMLDQVPVAAKRWAPLYKELRWEWNLYPRPQGSPSESDLIYAISRMIETHITYPDHLDVRSGGTRIAIEVSEDGEPSGVMEFADTVFSYVGEEVGE